MGEPGIKSSCLLEKKTSTASNLPSPPEPPFFKFKNHSDKIWASLNFLILIITLAIYCFYHLIYACPIFNVICAGSSFSIASRQYSLVLENNCSLPDSELQERVKLRGGFAPWYLRKGIERTSHKANSTLCFFLLIDS